MHCMTTRCIDKSRSSQPSAAGFDAEVKKANQSELGKRNGGAMLSMQVGLNMGLVHQPACLCLWHSMLRASSCIGFNCE